MFNSLTLRLQELDTLVKTALVSLREALSQLMVMLELRGFPSAEKSAVR